MSGWLYIIRNKDIYKIGITRKFENRMRKLKPDSVLLKFFTRDYIKLEKELHNRYRKFRIPQTEYFRLKNIHLREIKLRLSQLDYPMRLTLIIFIKLFILALLLFFIVFTFISLNTNDLSVVMLVSISLMEKILIGLSLISLFLNSNKNFSYYNEAKYRTTRFTFLIFYSLCFRIASFILINK